MACLVGKLEKHLQISDYSCNFAVKFLVVDINRYTRRLITKSL